MAIAVIARSGVARSIHGLNFPRGLRFLANALSIKAPIMGSFTASQIVQMMTNVPSNPGLIPSALVQNIEKIVDNKVNVIQPPQSPHI